MLTPIPLKLFQEIGKKGTLPSSFNEASFIPPNKRQNKKRELYTNSFNKHTHTKFPIKDLQTEFNNILKRSYTMIKLVSLKACKDDSTCLNQ
jgi:hypothetical protein